MRAGEISDVFGQFVSNSEFSDTSPTSAMLAGRGLGTVIDVLVPGAYLRHSAR